MKKRNVVVTAEELAKLRQLVESAHKLFQRDYLESLQNAIPAARVVDEGDKPADVVTLGAAILLRDLGNGESRKYCLVFPRDASTSGNRISVLSHLGSSLLGRRVGDVITLRLPWGERRFSIEAIGSCAEQLRPAA